MQKWDKDLYLLTPDELAKIPNDTVLTCISGKNVIVGKDKIDLDTRFGCTAYGIRDPWNHPLKDLFLVFKIIE